jgi:hypothetical protein
MRVPEKLREQQICSNSAGISTESAALGGSAVTLPFRCGACT